MSDEPKPPFEQVDDPLGARVVRRLPIDLDAAHEASRDLFDGLIERDRQYGLERAPGGENQR